jgi:DNA-directed RNA polymerase specialized sigma subunit
MKNIDEKIENALNDSNITKIMHKASNGFRNQLDPDEIYTCQINALWKAFLNFNPEKNVKFTTYLYNGVFIECLKELKFHNKNKRLNCRKLHENISQNSNPTFMIDILDEAKNEEEKSFIIDKYCNLTIKEMAKKRKSNRETVRKKLKSTLNRIRKNNKEVY